MNATNKSFPIYIKAFDNEWIVKIISEDTMVELMIEYDPADIKVKTYKDDCMVDEWLLALKDEKSHSKATEEEFTELYNKIITKIKEMI